MTSFEVKSLPLAPGFVTRFPEGQVSKTYQALVARVAVELLQPPPPNRWKIEAPGHPLSPSPKVEELLVQARAKVEERRQAVVRAAAEQMLVCDTPTLQHLDWLNPAERAWMERTADRLARIADALYAAQAHPENDKIDNWVAEHADPLSFWHYARIRTETLPSLLPSFRPTDIAEPEAYASSVALFPDAPNYSAMLPADFSPEELAFLSERYQATDPVRLPYTVVERASDADRASLADGPLKGPAGQEVAWLVEGLGGRLYKVTHIRFHPRFEIYFQKFAEVLEQDLDREVNGAEPHQDFQDYVREMASCLRSGDFTKLLQADLKQTGGRLFLSFFPHEGYWDDNTKFPWAFEVGIRDPEAPKKFYEKSYVFERLERRARDIARRLGAPLPSEEITTSDMQVVWLYRTGGFLRCFPHGEVAGHDYPKVAYPGVKGHRVVVIADTIQVNHTLAEKLAEEFLPPEDAARVTAEAETENTLWHEGSHRVSGNRPDTLTLGGKLTFGVAYGPTWGRVTEPQSDAAFAVAHGVLLAEGKISAAAAGDSQRTQFLRLLRKSVSKQQALNPKFGDPHAAGTTMTLGYLFLQGDIVTLGDDGLFHVDWEKFAAAQEELWEKLTEFGFQNSPEGFLSFYRKCVSAIPDAVETRFIDGQRRHLRRPLLNRGHLEPPPLQTVATRPMGTGRRRDEPQTGGGTQALAGRLRRKRGGG